jgi:hypothetical protein
VAISVRAVFNDDVLVASVIGILVGTRAFTAFQGYGIIIYRHIAIFDEDVFTGVYIHCIGARSFYRLFRRVYVQVEKLYVFAFIKVSGPERRVH